MCSCDINARVRVPLSPESAQAQQERNASQDLHGNLKNRAMMEGPHGKYHTAIRLARNQGSERGNATIIRLEPDLGKGGCGTRPS